MSALDDQVSRIKLARERLGVPLDYRVHPERWVAPPAVPKPTVLPRKNARTSKQVRQIAALWAIGFSASRIVEIIGGTVTRNAVIGMANRNKWPKRKTKYALDGQRVTS